MHLDNYEIKKSAQISIVYVGRSNAPHDLSQAEKSSLSNVRDMEFEIWYNRYSLLETVREAPTIWCHGVPS